MIDSHCHLTASQFDTDQDKVIKRALEAGVSTMICIADSIEESERSLQLAKKNPQVIWSTAGIHPHNASNWNKKSLTTLRALSDESEVVGIGEIGLDYHYMNSPRDVQKNVFLEQLHLAKDLHLPAVVHSRKAIDDTWGIIQNIQPQKLVLHCCTEKYEDVERFINAGYLLSFTGIATYKKI